MATPRIAQVAFQGEGFESAVVACFDTPHASSDGRAILLKSVDTHLGLTRRLARCLVDERQPDVAVGTRDGGIRGGEDAGGVRTKAADGVRAVEEKAGKVLDRGGDALHRVDDFLQDTKEHVSEALRAGQEAIRPASAVRKA